MTHSIDAPFPPPPSTGTGATSATSGTTATTTTTTPSTGSPSTSDVAKDEATLTTGATVDSAADADQSQEPAAQQEQEPANA